MTLGISPQQQLDYERQRRRVDGSRFRRWRAQGVPIWPSSSSIANPKSESGRPRQGQRLRPPRRCAGGQSGSVGGQVQRVPEGFAQCLRKLLHSQGYIWHPCELNCGRKFARFFLVLHRIHPRILPLTIAARGITGRGRRFAALAALNIASRSDMDGPPQSCLFLLRLRPLLDTGMIVVGFFPIEGNHTSQNH